MQKLSAQEAFTEREADQLYRPAYHLSAPQGWMGDPSGLVYNDGLYHFYYWRHVVSTDLVHWEHKWDAFTKIDSIGQMSGSVVVDKYNSSGFGDNGESPFVAAYSMLRLSDGNQMQGLAYSNDEGNSYQHYAHNPVIDIGSSEFRDPQVFWHDATQRWVMVIAMAAERKVRFYGSENLKDWEVLSEFGPAGADGGVWECPDIFPLPVDGDTSHIRWLLQVDVQPVGGQYFLGDFDGEKFKMDEAFEAALPKEKYKPEGNVLFDFEGDLNGWELEGEAFRASPTKGALPMQSVIIGYEGEQLINSFYQGDSTTGKITSPNFVIDEDYINFLIGGGNHPGKTAINLLLDGEIVRTQTGMNTETMRWKSWEVSEFKDKEAYIEVVDEHKGGFGHINVDQIMLSPSTAKDEREKAFWIDYGQDFYAVRSWQDAPENDTSRIWIAWMSNWLYAGDVPTNSWQGIQSFPRYLALKTTEEGIRLVQQPLEKIRSLRQNAVSNQDLRITDEYSFSDFKPSQNAYELDVTFTVGDSKAFGLHVAAGNEYKTIIRYDVADETISIDRTGSGNTAFNDTFPSIASGPLAPVNGEIRLRILVDQSSIEVFGNGGLTVLSSLIFPFKDQSGVSLFTEGGTTQVSQFSAWELATDTQNDQQFEGE